ncbi:putative Electron transfer flavoprotein subunit beta, mitochondrial [Desulfamplus magnetovallimortis]|uniref:Electron transfer flavoprotein subunit beta n=1 Tax=Desulfamplus magnetovallimortis TaxID=1246637 RepID=A0A1W1HGE9_9BACT|nr:electron transfer flavoprotein subunit beta/FixA family protein [Desulfamplus magnetovallimortis]SLM31462.1 putative Electron transfer flavoprotein subunit beta, mitochondrial [Desulfamplus magnetovallimortis]
MKIYVCVKHVPDSAANIALKDSKHIDDNVTLLLNPYDEYAVTEAVSFKKYLNEKTSLCGTDDDTEVIVVSLGKKDAEKTLRSAMAMGADRGILIETEKIEDSITTARLLKAAIEKDGVPGIIFTGRESIDMAGMQTMFRLGANFGFPVANNVVKFTPDITNNSVEVETLTEASGRDLYQLSLPCVLGAGRGLNSPAYPTFPDVVKAKKKQILSVSKNELNIDKPQASTEIIELKLFAGKRTPEEIKGDLSQKITSLVKILKEEAKII